MPRYADADARPLADRRSDRNRIAEQSGHLADDGKSQPDAQPLRALRADLIVLVENPLQLVLRNAHSGILDPEHEGIVIDGLRNSHVAPFGIFERVAEQILQQLCKQRAIRRNHDLGFRKFQL